MLRTALVFPFVVLGFTLFEFGDNLATPAVDEWLGLLDAKQYMLMAIAVPVLLPLAIIGVVSTMVGATVCLIADLALPNWEARWPSLALSPYNDPPELHSL